MKHVLLQSLYFSRVERIGTAVLLLFCGLVYGIPYLLRAWSVNPVAPVAIQLPPVKTPSSAIAPSKAAPLATKHIETFPFDPNKVSLDDFVRLGLSQKTAQSICRYRDKGGKFRKPEDFKKIYTLSAADYERLLPFVQLDGNPQLKQEKAPMQQEAAPTLFEFDPNTAAESELLRLGLPERAAKSLLAYRSKGGVFRKKEDVQKIYNLLPADYERIAPYLVLPVDKPAEGSGVLRPTAYNSGAYTPFKAKVLPIAPIDLNRSSLEDWMGLPGIGEKRARQILTFREKLGGFLLVEQVAETRGLPDSVFQGIKTLLVPSVDEVRRININTATREDLSAHPYCSSKQAEQIVNYRAQHGPYRSIEEINQIEAFRDKQWLAQIKRYLRVD